MHRRNAWDEVPNEVKEARRRAAAAATVSATRELLAGCPRAVEFMRDLADNEVDNKRKFSFQWIVEQVRTKDFTNGDGSTFRVNNNVIPILARLYLKGRPEAEKYVECRVSRFDGLV